MTRNRMIKADFWADEKIGNISTLARLLFIGTWNFADDGGICRANEIYLRNNIFPYDDIPLDEIKKAILQLCSSGVVVLLEYSGEKYLQIKNFLKHQTINKPSKFRYINELEAIYSDSVVVVDEHSPLKEKEKEKEKEKVNKKENEKITSCKQDSIGILNYFNLISGKGFKPIESNLKLIKGRLNEYSADELKAMIDFKVNEWKNDKNMSKYLRPETLFNATKCASYIEQSKVTKNTSNQGQDDEYERLSADYGKY